MATFDSKVSDDAGATWYKMFTPYLGGNIIVSDDGLSIFSFSGGMDVWRHNLPITTSVNEILSYKQNNDSTY